jgi:hypothetical protein
VYVSVEQAENASTESVEIYLHFNIFVVFIMSPSLADGGIQFYRPFVHFNPLDDYRIFHHWFSGDKTP